ncbi:MAG: hypothetical protein LH619_14275 [Chitinophagaceae bacterium]|nr:hypothetical protein [Chitinophagaceae bacterium]
MRQVTLHIPDSSYRFFMELAKNLHFVKKIEEEDLEKAPTKKQVLDSITEGIKLAGQHKQGKLKLKTAKQLLDEL